MAEGHHRVPEHEVWRGFLDAGEAASAYEEILRETPWRHDDITIFGRTYPQPRLTALYGDEGAVYTYSRIRMEPREWTPRLDEWRRRLEGVAGATFNSVLVNLYRDGRDSNGWHADDEPELGDAPVNASLSLGSTRTMRFRRRDDTSVRFALELAAGDLLVMRGRSQVDWLHCIPKTARIVPPRVNLTFRLVIASDSH